MKRFTLFFFIIALFFSCKSKNELKVGFLFPNFTDARYLKDRDFFSAKFKSLGGSVEFGDANNDAQKQEKQAEEMIKNGANVLVITSVNQNTAASIVRMAKGKGVKVICYERLIQNADVDYFIAYDHYEVGKIQAQYALSKIPQGNYVILCGDKRDNNAELIMKGQTEVISKSSAAKVIYKAYIEDWSEENAYKEMQKVLDLCNEKVDAVLAANDGISAGAIKALSEIQPDYPVITTGLDADLSACKRIMGAQQSMTVYKSFKVQGEMAAELAYKILKGEKISEAKSSTDNGSKQVPSILLVPVGVDQANIKSTIVADGFYTEKQLSE
jgi:D-xylose transport system substrate-binding protein